MYLKSRIGQRRIRHSELVAWQRSVAILHLLALDPKTVLAYWGRTAWQCHVPCCVFARRRARNDRAWADFNARREGSAKK